MVATGDLDQRVRFERRSSASGGAAGDKYGRAAGGWSPMFGSEDMDAEERAEAASRWARFEAKAGRETFAGRIEGTQAYELVIRRDPETVTITNGDRAVVLVGPVYLNITTIGPHPKEPREYLLATTVAGGANG